MNIGEIWVHCESQIGRQSPRSGGPCQKRDILVLSERKINHNRRVADHLVVLRGLKIAQNCDALGGVGHDLAASVDKALIVDLFEDPPDRLHERSVHCLIVVVEIDPSAHSVDHFSPKT